MGFGKEVAPPSGILLPQAGSCQPVQLQILTTISDRQAAVNRNQKNKKRHIVTLLQLGVVIRRREAVQGSRFKCAVARSR